MDWTEHIITITLDEPPGRADVWANVAGPLALHASYTGDYWCVTHVPTGILVWWEHDAEVAKHALICFLASPIDWSPTNMAAYRTQKPLFELVIAAHRRWRRHRAFRYNLYWLGRHRRRHRA